MTNPNWNSIIVEDDPGESKLLKTMIRQYCPQVKVLSEVTHVSKAVDCIQKLDPNLVFCNVSLSDGSAFEMIDQLDGFTGHLIFLSKSEQFALRAFRYNAFDYLVKPLTPEVLQDVIGRLTVRASQTDSRSEVAVSKAPKFNTILLHAGGMRYVVQIANIIHLEGDGNYSTVYLAGGEKILVSKPLKYFEDILPAKNFYRVHQSHIVNLENVKSVQNGDTQMINLSNGNSTPLSRRKKDTFLAWLARQ